jgi:hypothetical protein
VEIAEKKRIRFCLCIILCTLVFFYSAEAQRPSEPKLPSFLNTDPNPLPNHIVKDKEVGSPYLTRTWVSGDIQLENHKHIPDSNQYILFNYDKIQSIIYLVNDSNKVMYYPVDSVVSFALYDVNKVYNFEKIPLISSKFYVIPVIKSEKGYSLYKRLITNFYWADYSTDGYTSKGKKYDEFLDSYIYYLVYPGNTVFHKLLLKESAIRRDLKEESVLLKQFFEEHDKEIDEQSLLAIIQYIDDKKYPE